MRVGTIQNIIETFKDASEHLQVDVPLKKIEALAVLIHKVMTGPARIFHTPEHIFTISDPSDPLLSLAALFHDLVYYQVDRGFSSEIFSILSPYIQEKDGEISITEKRYPNDRLFMLTLDVFGFDAGQRISPFGGLNEFLSALVMNKTLEGIVPEKELLQITVCIEATIPFRGRDARGKSYADVLEERLRNLHTHYNISMQSVEVEDAIKRAVTFMNKDVENFSENDVRKFLDNTWKLLPETNIALRSGKIYSIKDYRQALQKMESFFDHLNPDNVFTSYRGVPPENEFHHLVTRAHANISIAHEYIGIKLLAIAILEALAEMTGGDAPLALFMGDLQREGEDIKRLEDFLPAVEASDLRASSLLATLLTFGRVSESNFDMKSSPTSFFLYKTMGPAKIKLLLDNAKEMFAGRLSAQEFLDNIDKPVVSAIAKACASMVVTRSEELLQFTLQEQQDI